MSTPVNLKRLFAHSASTALSALLIVGMIGCAKKPKESAKTEASAAPAAPSLSPAEKRAEEQKAVEELAANLKTQEDFEEAAEQDITQQSLEAELAKLGAEIETDPDTLNPNASAAAPAAPASEAAK